MHSFASIRGTFISSHVVTEIAVTTTEQSLFLCPQVLAGQIGKSISDAGKQCEIDISKTI
jgi:hypothetical protein